METNDGALKTKRQRTKQVGTIIRPCLFFGLNIRLKIELLRSFYRNICFTFFNVQQACSRYHINKKCEGVAAIINTVLARPGY